MITAESMLSKRPVLRITAALSFLVKLFPSQIYCITMFCYAVLTLAVPLPTKLLFLVRESNYNVSIVVLRVVMRFMKFYCFSAHHLIGVGNNVNWS